MYTPKTGEAIKQIRGNLGLNMRDFAKQIGISHVSVCQYELGDRRPSVEVCFKIIELAARAGMLIGIEDILVNEEVRRSREKR